MELSIFVSCVPTSPFKSESVIVSGFSPVFTGQLCALCKSALCVVSAVLNLIFNCLGFKLAVTIYGGLFTGQSFFIFFVFLIFLFTLVMLLGVTFGLLRLGMAQY